MSARVLLRPSAKRDVDEIWTFTASAWSIDQAEHYVRNLHVALVNLSRHPGLGRACEEIRAGYRKHPYGSHVIFYRPLDDGIDVVRILHGRMDVKRRL